jgi:hypothetical protein
MFSILLSFAVIFSILIFIKIFQQSKLLNKNSPTLTSAKRAAVYCILQASLSFINLSGSFLFYTQFYVKNESSLEYVTIFLAAMNEIIYFLTLICDAIFTLTVLQTYRKALWEIVKNVVTKLLGIKPKPLKVKSINQLFVST